MVQKITVAENLVQVNLSGSMYVEEAVQLRESLMGHIAEGRKQFIIDLGGVDYIDGTGLGTLLHIRNRTRKNGGIVIIKGLKGLVKDLFELTRLNMLFEIQ